MNGQKNIKFKILVNFRNKVPMTWLSFVVCCVVLNAIFRTVSVGLQALSLLIVTVQLFVAL